MLSDTVSLLLGTAASLAAVHTLLGVDHSLPFVALGRARGWPLSRTLAVTAACGLVHVASSVLIGGAGLALGMALEPLASLESARGRVAAWLMIGFGLAYAARAVWRGVRAGGAHLHPEGARVTTWTLFLIFAFGPCEALIPLMMVPAAARSGVVLLGVVVVFGVCTVGAMLGAVTAAYLGLARARCAGLERQADLLAGLAVAASGAGVLALGL